MLSMVLPASKAKGDMQRTRCLDIDLGVPVPFLPDEINLVCTYQLQRLGIVASDLGHPLRRIGFWLDLGWGWGPVLEG